MRIEITKQMGDLQQESWSFTIHERNEITLVLSGYKFCERQTKRHGWKVKTYFNRFDTRDGMKESEVPLPDEVKQEAISQITATISVKKPNEFFQKEGK